MVDSCQLRNDIGWYNTAYLLTNAAFLLIFGKLYRILNLKHTFLAVVAPFEVGSAICGTAPNSLAAILGKQDFGVEPKSSQINGREMAEPLSSDCEV